MNTVLELLGAAGSNYARMAIALGSTTLLMPAMFAALGARALGLWQLLFSVCGILALLDCGLATTLVRVASQACAADDMEQRNRVVSTLAAVLAVTGALGALAAGPLASWLVPDTGLSTAERADFASALTLIALRGVALGLPLTVFRGALIAGRSVPLANAIQAITQLGYTATMVAVLWSAPTLTALAAVNLGWMLVEHAGYVAACFARLPGFAVGPRLVTPSLVRPLISSGARQLVINTAALVQMRLDVALVSRWVGLEAAGRYGVALRIVETLFLLVKQGVNAAAPHVAASAVDGRRLSGTLLYLTRYVSAAAALAAVPLWVSGGAILTAWLGPDGALAQPILEILLASTVAAAALSTASLVLGMGGDENRLARVAAGSTVANVVASIALAGPLGARGVALGTVVAVLAVELPGLVPPACARAAVTPRALGRFALVPALAAAALQASLTAPLAPAVSGLFALSVLHVAGAAAGLAVLWALRTAEEERFVAACLARTRVWR